MRPCALAVALLALALPSSAAAAQPSAKVRQGLHLYGRYCVMCHGPNGVGQEQTPTNRVGGGPARDQIVQEGAGPPLRGVGAMAAHFYLSTGYMPLRNVGEQPRRARLLLAPTEIDALIAYVASLGKGPPVPRPRPERGNLSHGQHLFTIHCAGCHQVVARGGYVTGAVPPPLGDATAVQIAEAVRLGPYVMPKFSKTQISDRELDSVVRYVLWTQHPADRGGWAIGRIGPIPEGLVTWFLAASVLVGVCLVIGKRLRGSG
jgi:ubiquinol-cytochrome c reductase cytochrome c subunit